MSNWFTRLFSGNRKEKVIRADELKPQQEQVKKLQSPNKQSRLTDAYPDYPLTLGRFSSS